MSVSKDPVRGTYYVQCWFEDFSWEGIEFPADFSREELLSCGFVDRKENVVLYGGSGNGKTHTAVALGLIAVSVNLFFTSFAKQARRSRKGGFTGCANVFSPIPVTARRGRPSAGPSACRTCRLS